MVDKTVTLYYLTKHNDEDIMMVPHIYNPKQNGCRQPKTTSFAWKIE